MSDPTPTLLSSEHFLNRELSLLEFNRRVLRQSCNPGTPLLERLRFLTICSTNLDEFFEIRVASHKERAAYGALGRGHDGRTSTETLEAISESAHELVGEQYRVLNEEILPKLEEEGIRVLRRSRWTPEQREWSLHYFREEVMPVLTPMGLDPAHPFPKILNKSLNFIVQVRGEDAYGRHSGIAIVQVPRALPRVIAFPRDISSSRHDYVMLSSVIHAHVEKLFLGMQLISCHQFRITRNGDLWVDEEETDDLLKALEGELPEREYGAAVRLEVTQDCPESLARFLLSRFQLPERDLYRVDGPVNLHRLVALHSIIDRPDLKYDAFTPYVPKRIQRCSNIFEELQAGDVLLHHPYESFQPVLEFVRQAATDPMVIAIKITLYRVGANSPIVEALIDAARAGKEVTVVVELRARFDEAENIDLATRLQEVGAKVVYGIVGYKTHCKMCLVLRREDDRLRRYAHLGTGNYHAGTARAYTDIGLLTSRDRITEDVHRLFTQLTGLGQVHELSVILQSPFDLKRTLLDLIGDETESAMAGRPAHIMARMNAITEPDVIRALYRASQAGVRIQLIVRGACCLRPGVPGVSDNIQVRSVIGRFLEHSRIYYFFAGGREVTLCSSADWMSRNLIRRVETCFPVEDAALKRRIVRETLELYLADNQQAWELGPDGSYTRVDAGEEVPFTAQVSLLEQIAASDEPATRSRERGAPSTRASSPPG